MNNIRELLSIALLGLIIIQATKVQYNNINFQVAEITNSSYMLRSTKVSVKIKREISDVQPNLLLYHQLYDL